MSYVTSGRPVGRPRQFYKYELPSGVVKVVRAQCADYARKELCIREGSLSEETLSAYIATNAAINKALSDIEAMTRAKVSGVCRTMLTTIASARRSMR